jgi:hypothetical protein
MATLAALVKLGTKKNPPLAPRIYRAAGIVTKNPPRPVKHSDSLWLVPSASRPGVKYLVDTANNLCTCPDFRQHIIARSKGRKAGAPAGWCKHRLAVEMVRRLAPPPAEDLTAALTANIGLLA